MTKDIITEIVGEELAESWLLLKPKIYYKDDKPYGMIATIDVNGITYVASTAKNIEDPFTVGMLRDLIKIAKVKEVCVITDAQSKFTLIQRTLDKIGKFSYTFKDDVMFSTGKIE